MAHCGCRKTALKSVRSTEGSGRCTWQAHRAANGQCGRKTCCARLATNALIIAGAGASFGAIAGRGAAALGAHILQHRLQPARLRVDAVTNQGREGLGFRV